MCSDFQQQLDQTVTRATARGALQSIRTEQTTVTQSGIGFLVRWVSSLAHKDAARVSAAGRRDPDFNPFLPPEPDLTVGPLGQHHLAVLNKYPVIPNHLLIVTRAFVEQTAPLTAADFDALGTVMSRLGGLGFYNGGTLAGASQRHKHLQWIPASPLSVDMTAITAALPGNAPPLSVATHPGLAWRHRFVALPEPTGTGKPGEDLYRAFRIACEAVGMDPDDDPMPPYNLLVDARWLYLLPRSQEHFAEISVNALGFAGSLFVRRPEQIETVRRIGPLGLLAAVACP